VSGQWGEVHWTNVGLLRAAVLGLRLIGDDEQLKEAIRQELERARSRHAVDQLERQRRKLLRLYYDDRFGADLFAEEEARLAVAITAAKCESDASQADAVRGDNVARHFDEVAEVLAALDVERTWAAATEVERRVLLDEFLECITVLPDYIDVNIHGAPPIHVLYQDVGLKKSECSGVGGGTEPPRPCGTSPSNRGGQARLASSLVNH